MLRVDEIFNLHLLKLAATEDKITRRNFITKCLTLLSDTKRQIRIKTIDDVFEISEDALGGFRAKVYSILILLNEIAIYIIFDIIHILPKNRPLYSGFIL